jgi:hypothetical protein
MAVYILIVLLAIGTLVASESVKQRLNFGVIFRQRGGIQFGEDYWLHTYQIDLPRIANMSLLQSKCPHRLNATCLTFANMLTRINGIRAQAESQLNSTMEQIHKLIPERPKEVKKQIKRALLPFVGDFAKTLFGVATVDDLNVLVKHIKALTRSAITTNNLLAKQDNEMSSFISVVDTRFENAITGIEQNHIAISRLHESFYTSMADMEGTLYQLISILAHQEMISDNLSQHLSSLVRGVNDLVQEKLSPNLLSSDVLEQTIHDLAKLFKTSYKNVFLIHEDVQYYYANAKFVFARQASKFYLTIRFPIASSQHKMDLYDVISLAVPVNESKNHATKLLELPTHLRFLRTDNIIPPDLQIHSFSARAIHM